MVKFIKKREKKIGLPPGTPVFVGEKKVEKEKITIIDYDEKQFQEKDARTVEECFPFKDTPTVTWINVDGVHQVDVIENIGKHFELHPLVREDIMNTEQRPKMEDFERYIYIVLKMLYYDEIKNETKIEQVSLILGENFVISFQEMEGDIFDPIRERIRNGKGRIRRMGADYLAYALLDAIVDKYFLILEKLGERIESMEEEVMSNPKPEIFQEIHRLKREMIFLRKSVWPLREVINALERGESSLIRESSRIYLKDVYDHTIQVIDTVETFRDMVSGMHDTYLSVVSNRMNEVMKVLTIIATIFIPLTFIAGIYGMNFKFMPELEWRWAYFAIWIVILIVAIFMVIFFRRKKWL
ncbi:MAG: magnesium/cobalt transporter CorA [Candidatus Aminicenantes bacterium]|nr:magnesium/cobalt transporter CorA [Candidatus Aminicenantes bacterium]